MSKGLLVRFFYKLIISYFTPTVLILKVSICCVIDSNNYMFFLAEICQWYIKCTLNLIFLCNYEIYKSHFMCCFV